MAEWSSASGAGGVGVMMLFFVALGFLVAATVFGFTPLARRMQAVDTLNDVVYPALSVLPPTDEEAWDGWEARH